MPATRREDKASKSAGRVFFAVVFVLFPFLFIIGTIMRVWAQFSIGNEFSGSGVDRMELWIGGSILCALWLFQAFRIMTATGSSTDAERAWSWYNNTWEPMYRKELDLWGAWHRSHSAGDRQALEQFEASMEKWKAETRSKIIELELGSAGHLLHYTWGSKQDWDYLDKEIKDKLGIQ